MKRTWRRLPSRAGGFSARHARLRPALSPSKQNTTVLTRETGAWRCFLAGKRCPSVATALVTKNPCWARAITSLIAFDDQPHRQLTVFAGSASNGRRALRGPCVAGVFREFRYLGLSSPRTRPAKPSVRPRLSRIGRWNAGSRKAGS